MGATQEQKGQAFAALHARDGVFAIPNPWDVGSARMLEALGFEALATTSSGFAQTLGRMDGEVSLTELLDHCRALTEATTIPITVDLENGFADDPQGVADAIVRVAQTGVSGASIEDYTGDARRGIYDVSLATERIAAAAEAARALNVPFLLTARAENQLRAAPDMEETVRRLQAYEAAGADVLYAPALSTLDEVRQVAAAVQRPLNVLGPSLAQHTVLELGDAGAKRVSVGGALARLFAKVMMEHAGALQARGDLSWILQVASSQEIRALFKR